ncbi:unnamed protein product [Heterobilharzia americana]|nr:unnamed protein product [Heterobilharzia americana]
MNQLKKSKLCTIFNLFCIIIIIIIIKRISSQQQNYPSDFRSLNLGSCLSNGGDLFCQQYRRNSFCSIHHDECFCSPGYVSIYETEDSWYTCKPLITDLYCRMDLECSHIHGSICHPGVGACVCPSGYEFVFQKLACLRRVNDDLKPFCAACQRSGGTCVMTKDGVSLNNQQSDLQCACPRKRWTKSDTLNYPFFNLCNSTLADIGEECNHVNRLCLSQAAICFQTSYGHQSEYIENGISQVDVYSSQSARSQHLNICICSEGMIPVYQKNMDYFECFTEEMNSLISDCQSCFKSQGKCYHLNRGSLNITTMRYGCVCPLFKQNISPLTEKYPCSNNLCIKPKEINSENDFKQNMKISNTKLSQFSHIQQFPGFNKKDELCTKQFIQVTCNQERINICYKNPYKPSSIPTNSSSETFVVYLQSSSIYPKFIEREMNHSSRKLSTFLCHLNQNNDGEFCSVFNIQMNHLKQCGIYEMHYKYGSIFYGTLHAGDKRDTVSMLRNFHIDFLCFIERTQSNQSVMSTSYFYDRSTNFFPDKPSQPNKQLIVSGKTSEISAMKYVSLKKPTKKAFGNTGNDSVSLPILNFSNQITLTIIKLEGNNIRLRIISILPVILIEYCLIKDEMNSFGKKVNFGYEDHRDLKCLNVNQHKDKNITDITGQLVYQCILFERTTLGYEQQNDSTIWISQPFNLQYPVLQKYPYFTCLIRVCRIKQYCTYANLYSLNEMNEEQNDSTGQFKVYIPLMLWNNNLKHQYHSLFPPSNLATLVQFFFIQSTLEINYTTGGQMDKTFDVHFRLTNTDATHSNEANWMKYILYILILIVTSQMSIFLIKCLKNFMPDTNYKLNSIHSSLLFTQELSVGCIGLPVITSGNK